MKAELYRIPDTFASLDDLIIWLMDQFQAIVDNKGFALWDEYDAQYLLYAYHILKEGGTLA